jgi:beta-xylosidase
MYMGMNKILRRFASILLCLTLVLQTIAVAAEENLTGDLSEMVESMNDMQVSTNDKTESEYDMDGILFEETTMKVTPTREELVANNYVLYLADCGSVAADKVGEGDKLGLYQSVTDKEYGLDSTGYSWGLRPNNQYSNAVSGSAITVVSGSAITLNKEDTYYYTGDVTYVSGTSGFYYDFELPEGNYEVTVGFKNPWSWRPVDIVLEGTTYASALPLDQNVLVESVHKLSVKDGQLNVFVHNPTREDQYKDPILNYIVVKVVPASDTTTLQTKVNYIQTALSNDLSAGIQYATESLSELYLDAAGKKDNITDLYAAITEAQGMVDSGVATEVEIQAKCDELDSIYENLRIVESYSSFSGTLGASWKDTNGVPIQAHGGQVQKIGGKWWWYGEDKTKGYRSNGISAYSSDDLYNWTFEGYVMRTITTREQLDIDPYFMNLYADYTAEQKDRVFLCINNSTSVIERPKMIYNQNTDKYVIWFHADGPTETSTANYAAACAGVAISDSPTGPFKFIDRYRLNVAPEDQLLGEWYETSKGFARDMNLFIDDDGVAYIIYSSEENRTMFISKLNDEYTYLATSVEEAVHGVDFVRLFPGAQREAPAIFKYNNKYYMITSGATGWDPNQARYWVSDDILGTWTNMGDPCVGDNYTTFRSQSTNVIPYDIEKGLFIYMGDRWISSNLQDSRYIWLPVEISPSGTIKLQDYSNWTLDDLETLYPIKLNTPMEDIYYNIESIPTTLNVRVYENNLPVDKEVNVIWDTSTVLPTVLTTITGTLVGYNRDITAQVLLIPDGLQYYIDSGATVGSDLYDIICSTVTLKNSDTYDKAFTEGSWGYSSKLAGDGVTDPDIGTKNSTSLDSFESGFWAYSNKKIEYVLPLEAGSYQLLAGFREWWNTTRYIGVSISYELDGSTVTKPLGNHINSGDKTVNYYFDLPVYSNVTVSIYEYTSSPDVILSWLAVTMASSSDVIAAKNTAIAEFNEYTSKLIDRKTGYTSEDTLALEDKINEGIALIQSATTVLQVEEALQTAKDNFYAVYVTVGVLIAIPILKYDFNETLDSTTITDVSNNGNNATLHGNATYVTDEEKGQVLSLDGTTGTFAELPIGLLDNKNELTIVMDVKSNLTSGNFFTYTIGKSDRQYFFTRVRGSSIYGAITKNTWSGEQKLSGTITSGVWSKLILVLSEDTLTMYIDGLKVNEITGLTTKISDYGTNVLSYLGKSFYSGDGYFNGYFDNLEIYDTALTADEMVDILGTEILTTLPTVTKIGEPLPLPETISLKTKGTIIDKAVTWDLIPEDALDVIGDSYEVSGTVEGTDMIISTTLTVVSSKLMYYMEANRSTSDIFDKLKANSSILINTLPDQPFDGNWGYVGTIGTNMKGKSTTSTNRYDNGWYSVGGNDIVYQMLLEEGIYSLTAGFREWWNQSRHMDLTIEYTNSEGNAIIIPMVNDFGWSQVNGSVPVSDRTKNATGTFTIPEDALVTFRVAKIENSQDPVFSWLAIEQLHTNKIKTATIYNGDVWTDINNKVIQAHGGSFLYEDGTYYWFGENKEHNGATFHGVSVYSSKDLMNWKYENDILTPDSAADLASCKVERPKVMYNEATDKYVMWGHYEEAGNYNLGHVVVAISDTITGDYEYLGHFDPGNQSRDFTVFVDDDKAAYLISSARSNLDIDVYRLNESYTDVEEKLYTLFVDQRREAPAIVKKDGYYYMLTSGQSGWQPNQGYYSYTTDFTNGDGWSELIKFGNTSTFYSQPANVLTINGAEATTHIYIGDRWNQNKLGDSRFIWLPMELNKGIISMDYAREWKVNAVTGYVENAKKIVISTGKSAKCSNQAVGFEAAKAIDGDYDSYFDTGVDSMPYWWRVDLGKAYNLSDIDISWRAYKGSEVYYKYIIEGSNDDTNYTTIVDATSNTTTSFTAHSLTGTYRYVRITVTGQININNNNSATWYRGIHEVRIYGDVNTSVSNAFGIAVTAFKLSNSYKINNINLNWAAYENAMDYQVYRGEALEGDYELIYSGSSTSLYDYSLELNKTYYYKVKAFNNGVLLADSSISSATTKTISSGLLKFNNNISNASTNLNSITTVTELKSGDTYYRYDYERDENGFLQLKEYTSSDSINWTYNKVVMDRNSHEDLASCKLEAMNIRYDSIHNKNIIWAHWELKDGYASGKVLIASATPGEAFNVHEVVNPLGVEVRDMNFFIDDDENKTGYLIAASNLPGEGANATMYIFKMNETYTGVVEVVAKIFENQYREAPSMIKKDGYYYLFTSQAAGWYPSKGNYASTDNIAGPWSDLKTIGNTSTFSSQSGGIITFDGEAGKNYVMAANRWVKEEGTTQNVLLPITFSGGYASYDYYESILYNPWTGEVVPEQTGILLSGGKPATASITASGTSVASKANDGNYYSEYLANKSEWPFWWQVDLEEIYDLSSIQVSWFMYKGSEGYYQYQVQTSDDGVSWTTILDQMDNGTYGFTAEDLEGSGRFVRLYVEKAVLHNNPSNWYTPTLYEVKIFGKVGSEVLIVENPVIDTNPVETNNVPNDGAVQITLNSATADAEIFYTIDGTNPDSNATKYTGSFSLSTTMTEGQNISLKAIALKAGYTSQIVEKEIIFKAAEVLPTATPTPTDAPTATPTPTDAPTATPTPTDAPTATPTPTDAPTATPTPTDAPQVNIPSVEEISGSGNRAPVTITTISSNSSLQITVDIPINEVLELLAENGSEQPGSVEPDSEQPTVQIPIISESIIEKFKRNNSSEIDISVNIPEEILENAEMNQLNMNMKAELLQLAAESKRDIHVSVKTDSGKELYTWSFLGEDLSNSDKVITDVNLTLTVNQITKETIGETLFLDGNNGSVNSFDNGFILNFNHEGVLPAQASVRIYVGDLVKSNKPIYLYHYNKDTGKLETLPYSSKYIVDKEGYITINLLHCSDYMVLPKKANKSFITPIKNQISITPEKKTLYLRGKNSTNIQIQLPVTLQWVESMEDRTNSSATGAVTVTFESSNVNVAIVDNKGKIIAKEAGVTIVTTTITLYSKKTVSFKTQIIVK